MARQAETIVHVTDDMDGTEGTTRNPVNSVVFGLGNQHYELDLTQKNEAALREALMPFITKARPVSRLRASSAASSNGESGKARAWAKEQTTEDGSSRWPDLGDKGKLPDDVWAAYQGRDKT
jgi:Lsr2